MDTTEIDVVSLEQLLVRIAPQLAPADHALIEKLVRTLLGLLRQVREYGTTIARLRRFIGMSGSEKTRAVLGRKQGEDELAPDGANPAAPGGGGDPSAGEAGTPEPEPPTPKPPLRRPGRKGHGRLGVSAYPHACHVPVAHESLVSFRRRCVALPRAWT